MRHLFFSYRPDALSRWREAFPHAEFHLSFDPGTLLAPVTDEAVIWLHAAVEREDLATVVARVKSAGPSCPMVVLSNLPSEAEGLIALGAGAAGYCNALAAPELLRQVASVVTQGGVWVGADLLKRLFGALAARGTPETQRATLHTLSPREAQVAQAVARGASNKEIAQALAITERTVKAHLTAVFEKLGVRDRMQLALFVNGVEAPTAERPELPA